MKHWKSCLTAAIIGVVLAIGGGSPAAAANPETVTISGNAWAFVLSGTTSGLEGAVIKIAEHPELETVSGENGAWSLEVPNNESITPYATAPGRYPVYDQTFYTSGHDLNQINFQMPPQDIAETFAALIGASMSGEEGSKTLDQCAIVSTVYQKEGRSFFDFDDFLAFAPHGVVGATAEAFKSDGTSIGEPVYFNSSVIPDVTQEAASKDGGMVWSSLPAGTYTVTAKHETARFSQFQATCEPGRLVNASPPWGLYEMNRNEEPNPAVFPAPAAVPDPADEKLEAWVTSAKVVKKGAKKRLVKVKVKAAEQVTATVLAKQGARKAKSGAKKLGAGNRLITVPLKRAFRGGSLNLKVTLKDAAGNRAESSSTLFVPKPKKR